MDGEALVEKEESLAACLRTLEVVRGRVRAIQGKEAAEQLFGPRRGWPGGWGAGEVGLGMED